MKDIDRKKIGNSITIVLAIGMFLLLGTKQALAVSDVGFSVVGLKQLIADTFSTGTGSSLVQKIGISSDYQDDVSHANAGVLLSFDVMLKAQPGTTFFMGLVGLYGGETFFTNMQPVVSGGYDNFSVYRFTLATGLDFAVLPNRGFRIQVLGFPGTMPNNCQWVNWWDCGITSSPTPLIFAGSANDVFFTTSPHSGNVDNTEESPVVDAYFVLNTLYTPPPPPTCFTTNPVDMQTITGAFNITGECNDFGVNGLLFANLVDQATGSVVFTNVDFIFAGTPFSIPVENGVPVGDYELQFVVRTADQIDHNVDPGVVIYVVVELPPGIGGEPGTIIGAGIDPGDYYPGHSNYTTPTAFYTSITGTIAPLLGSLNNWGQSFMDKFSQTDAVANGSNIGNSLAIVRVYSSNINSLFNDFPVAQAIGILVVWYLALAILTSIRFIIKLIK